MVLKVTIPKLHQLIDKIFDLLPFTVSSLQPKIGSVECIGPNRLGLNKAFVLAGYDPVLLEMLPAVRDAACVSDGRVGHLLKSFAEGAQDCGAENRGDQIARETPIRKDDRPSLWH